MSTAPTACLLIVEDYEPNILVATLYLDALGYAYETATSGQEGFEKFKTTRYAAILMDVQMPGLNGLDATRLIRQYETEHGLKRTRIIGMTAHALAGDRDRCLDAGMDDYIAKPMSEASLKAKLEKIG